MDEYMKTRGLVSIVTPSWNCGKFLEETIKSIQSQTYTNWELLFQDDCSTDDTYKVAEEYRQKCAEAIAYGILEYLNNK